MRNLLLTLAILVTLPLLAETNDYRVTIADAVKTAHVEATLSLPTKGISLFNVVPAKGLAAGQAGLIEHLAATNASLQPLTIKDLGEGDYELSESGIVHLSYDVRLEHDQYEWPAGVEEVSYRTSEGLMITGFALFFASSDKGDTPCHVRFDLPKGWRAVTPWTPDGDGFVAASRRELLNNALFLGTSKSENVSIGGVELTLLLGPCCAADKDLFVDLLRTQLDSYAKLFGAKPLSSRYLIIINEGSTGDGGAFASSFSQFIKGHADIKGRVIWGHVMSHELLHFWNGLSLVPADWHEEWFKEGFTDYLTIVTMYRNGLVSGDVFRNRLENLNRRYMLARFLQGLNMSVRDSGEEKQKNRLLVYAGGSLTALALDIELRKATNDKKGLPDLMQAMFREFGVAGKRYTIADIERIAAATAGHDMHPFFVKAVGSPEVFDIGPWLGDIGLRLDQFFEEQFVSVEPSATAEQKARFQAMFGKAF